MIPNKLLLVTLAVFVSSTCALSTGSFVRTEKPVKHPVFMNKNKPSSSSSSSLFQNNNVKSLSKETDGSVIHSQTALFESSRGGASSSEEPSWSKKLLAEALGTFLIVHLGCGTVCSAIFHSAQVGLWQIAAVWSLAVSLAIYSTAAISGAHLNPAISIAMFLLRKDLGGWSKVMGYIVAQVIGAFLAGGEFR